eukprot:93448_1
MSSTLFHISCCLALTVSANNAVRNPHIIYILMDDFGYANVEFHNDRMKTPNLNALLPDSLYLNNFYTYKYCSPTRSALMSGRLPYHVNEVNGNVCSPNFGVPLNMTMISEKLVDESNYVAHQVGKWHLGFASTAHIPLGRKFSSSLGYIGYGMEDHYSQICHVSVGNQSCSGVDIWDTDKPATSMNGTYNGYNYGKRAVDIINNHTKNAPHQPLFMYLATQNNHDPYQVPAEYENKFNKSWYSLQRTVAGMSNFEDELIGNVTRALKDNGLWNNTLLFITSDNGGCSGTDGDGANNSPLRGGKYSEFQGGVNVLAMVTGGYVPENRRNLKLNGTIHIADIYATLCSIVGIDAEDKRAAEAHLPPVDSINMWPFIIGETDGVSPRNGFVLSSGNDGGIVQGDYKLIFGNQNPAFWTTLDYPNGTQPQPQSIHCGSVQDGGCLFNIAQDPTEHVDLINEQENAALVDSLRERFIDLQKTKFSPNLGVPDPNCCVQMRRNGGYWGPWLDSESHEKLVH